MHMYISILGRQPEIGLAELRRLYKEASFFSNKTATIETTNFNLERLGGTMKAGKVVKELTGSDDNVLAQISTHYIKKWQQSPHKITLGISVYGMRASAKDVQKVGLKIKRQLKDSGVSLRLIPNDKPALNTATSHNNKLGLSDNKVELLIIKGYGGKYILAESVGAQNITAYAKRDQNRPKRDAFVGMLPPKLAQIIVNLATGQHTPSQNFKVLDPFCGTGVILQEASLMGFGILGSDLSEKMVTYTKENLEWLEKTNRKVEYNINDIWLQPGDATSTQWPPFNTIAAETYLGRPFSAPPSAASLKEVSGTCQAIVKDFIKNAASQLKSGDEFCIAVPAWRQPNGNFHFLDIVPILVNNNIERIFLGDKPLLYARDDQVVARHLYVLKKR